MSDENMRATLNAMMRGENCLITPQIMARRDYDEDKFILSPMRGKKQWIVWHAKGERKPVWISRVAEKIREIEGRNEAK